MQNDPDTFTNANLPLTALRVFFPDAPVRERDAKQMSQSAAIGGLSFLILHTWWTVTPFLSGRAKRYG